MADANTTTGATPAAEQKFVPTVLGTATRNGVTVKVQTSLFKRATAEKKGVEYVGVNTDEMSLEDVVKFIGLDEVKGMLDAKIAQKSQGLWREAAINPTNKSDNDVDDNELVWDAEKSLPAFVNSLQEWSAISETISDLKEKRDELVPQVMALVVKGDMEGAKPLAEQIRKIELDIQAKKRETKAEREARKAAEAKAKGGEVAVSVPA